MASIDWVSEYEAHETDYFPKGKTLKWTDSSSGKEFQQAPTGTHEAICFGVIDLGTQTGEWQGKPIVRRQVLIQWELPKCPMEDNAPFIVSKFYTASLNEKATLRHDLESWRGRAFTEAELGGFDSHNILGKPGLLSIIHNEAGKARVASVMAVPKGMTLPPQHNKSVFFALERGEYEASTFEGLGKGLQDMIRKSPEWQAISQKAIKEFDEPMDDGPIDETIPF